MVSYLAARELTVAVVVVHLMSAMMDDSELTSVRTSTASQLNGRFGDPSRPRAYSWWPSARFAIANCAAFVRSRQSTQFTRKMPHCSRGRVRCSSELTLAYFSNSSSRYLVPCPAAVEEVRQLDALLAHVLEDAHHVLVSAGS